MTPVAAAAERVPEQHYTHHKARGATIHRTNPVFIHRELEALDVHMGMNVAEVGTGSGLSGGLLAELVGPTGMVTSLDIDPYLTRWANHIHAERGVSNIRCYAVDGTAGYPGRAPYDRMVGWCTPPLLPKAWVNQVKDGGLIVATLPITAVPNLAIGAVIRISDGQPSVESIFPGSYIETGSSPRSDFSVPARWVDWESRVPATSWVSIAWREQDDWQNSGARGVLDRLREPGHTERYKGEEIDWSSLRVWLATTGSRLTMTELKADVIGLGHSTRDTAAVIQQDGTITADAADSTSLTFLRGRLTAWEDAGRPAPDTYTASLTLDTEGDVSGWDLRLAR
ncbi:protein-L-isoaspartate(D-aspartate) O-methyltransferase [Streptomyces albireticuli]|uniref:Protein-L-isoaspartate O-methyltransferase n=1 Tax=Streptomyces albireticuli TaxID=1940 RepID=A0A2A2D5J6_9ACTN|nr:protein-L-isoaspartate(D-aspartate) O-methyltransferase [Streptomyces albireticuli]MCD9195023.1 protein-L-isoaspartate(D-aspartate) O-methyltransferase [Streptomyces albireticuli]PAU46791.1 protein-L-isoaspartate(D-aspartate) O-methyltransferase [Streptomyces albireticuli]